MKRQRGNILFLILLAVVLFAALSYAVTQSTRGGGNNAGAEKLQTIAGEIINYATLVEQTVTRLRLSGGCSDAQISFLYDSDGDGVIETNGEDFYYNPNAPADKHCNVYDPAGGNLFVKPRLATDYLQTTGWLNNATIVQWYSDYGGKPLFITSNAVGTLNQDLIMLVPFVSVELCNALNRALNGSDNLFYDNTRWYPWRFVGQYNNFVSNDTSIPYNSGCAYKTGGDKYYQYFQVLIAR